MAKKRFVACVALLLAGSGCAAGTAGAAEKPAESAWRRQPIPLPPFYLEFTSASDNRWTMVTPLYWQVNGADEDHYHLFPLGGYDKDRAADRERGRVLNYFWGNGPGEAKHHVFFPIYWHYDEPGAVTSVLGPLYRREEKHGRQRTKITLHPWIFSRETDNDPTFRIRPPLLF